MRWEKLSLINIYSQYLNESERILIARARDNKEFNQEKRELLDKLLDKINKQSGEIINKYIKPLISVLSQNINIDNSIKFKLELEATTKSRLIINTAAGLGQTVFEVGLNIHPLFSIPYIPSSSIKGALRSYINRNYGDDKERIFGDKDRMGEIFIFDAFPISFKNRLVDAEVTTSIYGTDKDTIQEHKASPNPIIYPCIAKDVTFKFIIALKDNSLQEEITKYFYDMAKEGIGAKTMLGYGELR
jgi:CRISPR-associated protein Cmr6